MNSQNDDLNMWSPQAETEEGLRTFEDRLLQAAEICLSNPSEASALKCCEASRDVSDTIEGLLYRKSPIDPQLLSNAIKGLAKSVEAVALVQSVAGLDTAESEHVEKMLSAMTGRRDDLLILQKSGKVAFLQRA